MSRALSPLPARRRLAAAGVALLVVAACRNRPSPPSAAADPNGTLSADEEALSRRELLGKRLFEDASLSSPAGLSCASCHDPARAYQGDNGSEIPAVARGSRPTSLGARNTPTLLYADFAPPFAFVTAHRENAASKLVDAPVGGFFWDGRATTLSDQAREPILDPREMNVPGPRAFVDAVRAGPYAGLAREVVGAALDDPERGFDTLASALAAFEATARFHPFRSKFDDYLRGGAPLAPDEARGFALFKDPYKGNCISCHAGNEGSRRPEDWLFTDFSYAPLGVPRNRAIPANADPTRFDLGLCKRPHLAELAPPGLPLESLCGFFRVPSLRNVAVTAPYMHNGALATLREVVSFYVTRDTNASAWYPADEHDFVHPFDDLPFALRRNVTGDEVPYDRGPGEAPRLDPGEIEDVVAFLGTLTDR